MNKCEQFTALQLFSDTEPTGEFMPWKKRPDKDFFSKIKRNKGKKQEQFDRGINCWCNGKY